MKRELEFRVEEDWQQLIDTATGQVLTEGHRLLAEDVLDALGYEYTIVDNREE